jgi:Na+/melibiose symporter-like transporter
MALSGIVLLAAYLRHADRHPAPILDLRMFRIPSFRHSVLGGNLFRIAVGASPFLLPLMLQLGFGYSAFEAGLITFASALGALLMKFTVAPIVRRIGYRDLLIWNGLASCILLGVAGLFSASTPYIVMFGVLLLSGFLRSLQFSALNTLAYADVETPDVARANTLYTVVQQLFLALGVAMAAFMLDAQLWWRGCDDLNAADFSRALIAVAIISSLAVISYMKLDKAAGASISGRHQE